MPKHARATSSATRPLDPAIGVIEYASKISTWHGRQA